MASSTEVPQAQRIAYEHATRLTEVFLDWRHRVMQFTFTVVAALVALSAWMFQHHLGRAVGAPLILAGLIALSAFGFDHRNQRILQKCYSGGAELARNIGLSDGGPFEWVPATRDGGPSYHGILWVLYSSVGTVLIVLGGLALAYDPHP